jgi:hypothetical protein
MATHAPADPVSVSSAEARTQRRQTPVYEFSGRGSRPNCTHLMRGFSDRRSPNITRSRDVGGAVEARGLTPRHDHRASHLRQLIVTAGDDHPDLRSRKKRTTKMRRSKRMQTKESVAADVLVIGERLHHCLVTRDWDGLGIASYPRRHLATPGKQSDIRKWACGRSGAGDFLLWGFSHFGGNRGERRERGVDSSQCCRARR